MQRQLSPTQKRERFRELLARPGVLVMPGGCSPIYPTIAATAGMQAAWEVVNDLHDRGAVALDEWAARAHAAKAGPARQNALVGNDTVRRLEEQFLPDEQQRDYGTTFGHPTLT